MSHNNNGWSRDPVWQFIGVCISLLAFAFAVFLFFIPNYASLVPKQDMSDVQRTKIGHETSTSENTVPPSTATTPSQQYYYTAVSPGPNCDKGSGRWKRVKGFLTCQSHGTLFSSGDQGGGDATVKLDWPNYAFPHTYTIGITAADLNPTTCIAISVRTYYTVTGCAMGDMSIGGVGHTFAAKQFQNACTYLELTVNVNGPTLTLIGYSNTNGDTINLTTTDGTYLNTDSILLSVYTVNTTPAKAVLSNFQYSTSV